jgi:hypothetical protein
MTPLKWMRLSPKWGKKIPLSGDGLPSDFMYTHSIGSQDTGAAIWLYTNPTKPPVA